MQLHCSKDLKSHMFKITHQEQLTQISSWQSVLLLIINLNLSYPKTPQADVNYESPASLWIKQYYRFHSTSSVLYGSITVGSSVMKHTYCISSPLSLLHPNILSHCYHSKYTTADNMVYYHWPMSKIKKFEPEQSKLLNWNYVENHTPTSKINEVKKISQVCRISTFFLVPKPTM